MAEEARLRTPLAASGLTAAFAEARQGLRLRRRRSLLSALGIALAAAMLSAALVVSDSLGGGFDRGASAAGLPDVIWGAEVGLADVEADGAGRADRLVGDFPNPGVVTLSGAVREVRQGYASHGPIVPDTWLRSPGA